MVDVFAEVPADFRRKFGLIHPAEHISSEKAAAIFEALQVKKSPSITITSGGGAANTAKIAARLGLPAAFTGASGSDSNAVLFEEELKKAGVYLHLVRKKIPTGLFLNLSGCIAASPGASLEFNAEDINESLFAKEKTKPKVCMLEGFILDRAPLINRILELAEKYSLALAVDPGTAQIAAEQAKLIQEDRSPFWNRKLQRARYPVILFLNEAEAEAFAGIFNKNWESLFNYASRDSFVLAAVKLAERGAAVFSGGSVIRVSTIPVKAAESTGAGDAFAAGFLAAWLRNETLEQCGRAGNSAAALVLQAPGTS